MGRLIEGVWDCTYCDSKRIRGSIRECPVCGRQRDHDVRFYMADPKNYVDNETAKTISKNPDWICSYCDGLNADNINECHHCGASREGSEQNYFEHKEDVDSRRAKQNQSRPSNDGFGGNSENDRKKNHDERMPHISQQSDESELLSTLFGQKKTRSRFNIKNILKVGAGVLAAIMLVMCLVWVFTPKIQEVVIQDFSWERSINVQKLVTVDKSGWLLPADGRLQYSQQEIKGYEQVLDHYETKTETYYESEITGYDEVVTGHRDLGNGYFEEITSRVPVYEQVQKTREVQVPVYRDEPIYATKYYYEIDEWQHDYSSTSSGNDKDPYWKEVKLKDKQREGSRNESYYITVINNEGEDKKYSFDLNTWSALEKGDVVTIKTTVFGTAELVMDDAVIATQSR